MKKIILVLIVAGVAAAFAAYQHKQRPTEPASHVGPAKGAAAALLQAGFIDVEGKRQSLSQWRGKVIVVNFWATWCPPCRAEIPEFIQMQEIYQSQGVVFVGIALDQKDKVQAFVDEVGINYPVLLGGVEAVDLARQAGNRVGGLPFTVVFDRAGEIDATEMGEVNQVRLESLIKPLL